jgi:hypothetical protein
VGNLPVFQADERLPHEARKTLKLRAQFAKLL